MMEEREIEVREPGVTVSLVMPLGAEGRGLQFQTFVDQGFSQAEIDDLLDRMTKAAKRQEALHILPTYRRNREDDAHKTGENKKRLAEVNARIKETERQRDERASAHERQADAMRARGEEAHYAGGKRGPYKPQGAEGSAIAREAAAAQAVREAAQKELNEAMAERSTLENEVKEGERRLFKWDQLIAEAEGWVGP